MDEARDSRIDGPRAVYWERRVCCALRPPLPQVEGKLDDYCSQ
jgi:hypothetical protein